MQGSAHLQLADDLGLYVTYEKLSHLAMIALLSQRSARREPAGRVAAVERLLPDLTRLAFLQLFGEEDSPAAAEGGNV